MTRRVVRIPGDTVLAHTGTMWYAYVDCHGETREELSVLHEPDRFLDGLWDSPEMQAQCQAEHDRAIANGTAIIYTYEETTNVQ